ncbi:MULTISPECIES: hypothetical protein [unclassified Enterococcus]|uniref:hypothetical protein n=1 Tax=unclassified Enterococcus TaxID=2608891 RepID=UPI001A9BCD1D|nr:hypothetical protein [Enterococcus sp. DIV1271a]MBO1301088.1 hypothetical protein [Enterococcus sp. DIV1271a]
MTEIKRKHFRFPAYDDHIGVKLKNENRRVLFDGQDDLMTDTSDKPLFEQINEFHFEDYSKKEKNSHATVNVRHASTQKENLAKHKQNLPDYRQSNTTKTKRNSQTSFGYARRNSTSEQRPPQEKKSSSRSVFNSSVRERSYFVPKYVPASIIPDQKKNKISEEELIASIKKEKNAYLLFEAENTPYDGKQSVTMDEKKHPSKKNHGVLDRSLEGLINEQGDSLNGNGYFN